MTGNALRQEGNVYRRAATAHSPPPGGNVKDEKVSTWTYDFFLHLSLFSENTLLQSIFVKT